MKKHFRLTWKFRKKSRFLFCLIFQFYLMYRLICQKPANGFGEHLFSNVYSTWDVKLCLNVESCWGIECDFINFLTTLWSRWKQFYLAVFCCFTTLMCLTVRRAPRKIFQMIDRHAHKMSFFSVKWDLHFSKTLM